MAIGPGAHGRIWQGEERCAVERIRAPQRWLEAVEKHGHGTEAAVQVSVSDARDEVWLMGLRLTEGVARDRLFAFDESRVFQLEQDGLLRVTPTHVIATDAGRMVLNHLLGRLLG